jgi:hypothetical protein
VVVWGGSCRTGLARLQRLQDRTVRLFCEGDAETGANFYFSNKLWNLLQIYKYFIHVKFFQYFTLGLSPFFIAKIAAVQVVHSHETRFISNENLYIPFVPTSKFTSSFLYQGMKCWNELPIEVRRSMSVHI